MLDKKLTIVLIFLTLISLAIGMTTVDSNGYGSMINSLSVGFVVSSIFYFLVVYMPEYKRRNMARERLEDEYIRFKMSCINTFLILSDS